jgi:hypothetical protein
MVFIGLASKQVVTVSLDLASKPTVGFLVEPQNQGGGVFLGLGLKIGSSGLGPQNHRDGFLVWVSKPSGHRFVGCATKPTEGGRRGTRIDI